MKTTVVNIKETKDYDVFIGRSGWDIPINKNGHDGYFGNPFHLKPNEPRGSTLRKYKEYFHSALEIDPEFKARVEELRGKKLGCFCKPNKCHGDIIANYLN